MTTDVNYMYHPNVLHDNSGWKRNDNIKGWVSKSERGDIVDVRKNEPNLRNDCLDYWLAVAKENTEEDFKAYGGGRGGSKAFQVGGDHYKKAKTSNMQPWDIIDAWELDYYAGTVLKYLLRYKFKGGKEDLKKARHFLDKMIEDYDDNKNN